MVPLSAILLSRACGSAVLNGRERMLEIETALWEILLVAMSVVP
jgi:hypothetical protein